MERKITGKAWVGGDHISMYDIIPQRRWTLGDLSEEELGQWCLEDMDEDFVNKPNAFKDRGYTFIVAGACFGGGGKSMEHPIYALKGAGIRAVFADSFARFNFRNSINNALPVFECHGLKEKIQTDDELTLDMVEGYVLNHRTNECIAISPLSDFAMELIDAGGLLEHTRAKLKK